MREFGWNRAACFQIDSEAFQVWGTWSSILDKGIFNEGDAAPSAPISETGKQSIFKTLQKCMDVIARYGHRSHDLIDWVGYAIGIAWCSREPKFSEETEMYLETHFPWDELIRNPSDYLSNILAMNGSSGHLDYYPTPMTLSLLMGRLVQPTWTDSVIEPCIGPGSLILSVNSLNIVGMDLNLLMVKAACIHAFFYKPQLLYSPKPILGVHVHPDEKRVHKYFEFSTDTRIYHGNSLFGEFQAPRHIFEQDSVFEDIYLDPIRQRNREVYKYRAELQQEWGSLSKSVRFQIVKAMSREHSFDVVLTNPPFSFKHSKSDQERFKEIEEDNILFLASLEEVKAKPAKMTQLLLF